MRRLPPTLAALATIAALLAANCAEALPLGSRRPPPWFRGWERSVPFVASDYWWWPRYYALAWGRAIATTTTELGDAAAQVSLFRFSLPGAIGSGLGFIELFPPPASELSE